MTILTETVQKILKRLEEFSRLYGIIVNQEIFQNLKKESEKEQYVKEYEAIRLSFSFFDSIFKSMGHALSKLEKIRNSESGLSGEALILEISTAWQTLLLFITMIYKNIEEGIEKDKEKQKKLLQKEYKELDYCRLLRNEFIQHPNFGFPFTIPLNAYFPWSDKNSLPYWKIEPHLPYVLNEYYRNKLPQCTKKDFENIPQKIKRSLKYENFEELTELDKQPYIQEINKNDFLNLQGRKARGSEEASKKILDMRIKVYGLPSINQADLAEELWRLFETEIIPYLKNKTSEAEKRGMLPKTKLSFQ